MSKPLDLRVQQGGTTRLLSVGKLIPKDWEMVRVYIETEEDGLMTWRLQRLTVPQVIKAKGMPSKSSRKR